MSRESVPVVLETEKPIKIRKWKVKEGMLVSNRQIIFIYDLATPEPNEKQLKFKSSQVGTICKIIAKEGDLVRPGGVLFELNGSKQEQCTDILNREWKVYRVSPLYNFSFDKLKVYEDVFNKEMNIKKKFTSNSSYNCKLTVNKNLKLYDQSVETLQVKVLKDAAQTSYLGNLISLRNNDSEMEGSNSHSILLVEAKADAISAVHSTLSKVFDCDIQNVTFSLHALISFFVKLLETPRGDIDVSKEQVTMEYGVPECTNIDKIKISLCLEDTTVVFAVVMDNLQEKNTLITSMEIIWEFYKDVLNHIHQVYSLNLMFAELKKVAFPDAFLTSDGQLKMSTNDAAISALDVLKYFTSLDAVLGLHKRRLKQF